MPNEIFTKVVGVNFRGKAARERVNSSLAGQLVLLEKEPENPYDPNAIKVLAPWPDNPELPPTFIGYIPKEDNSGLLATWDLVEKVEFSFAGTDQLTIFLREVGGELATGELDDGDFLEPSS